METKIDGKGNIYIEADNLRITYIKQINRTSVKDWPNSDVVRIQAYRGDGTNSLHQGAEYPIKSHNKNSAFVLIEAFSKLFSETI